MSQVNWYPVIARGRRRAEPKGVTVYLDMREAERLGEVLNQISSRTPDSRHDVRETLEAALRQVLPS